MFDLPPDRPAADPADVRVTGRMAILREMAEIGLRQARRLDRQSELAAVYAETCAVPEHLQPPYARRLDEIARAFAQVSRAVSLAVALEDRVDADHRAGPAVAAERALKRLLLARRVAQAGGADSPATPRGALGRADPPPRPDARLRLDRRLQADLAELDAWLKRPAEEVIGHIRRELGLETVGIVEPPRSDPSGASRPAPAGRGSPPGAAARPSAEPPPRGETPQVAAAPTPAAGVPRIGRVGRPPPAGGARSTETAYAPKLAAESASTAAAP